MKGAWHQKNPKLAEQIRSDLRARYPNLHLFIESDGSAAVRGTFPVLSPEGRVLDEYRASIELLADYPRSLPVVREVGGRIPWKPDFHVNTDGVACVLLPDDRWRCFPEGAPFVQFLDGPVHDFFLGQSLVALGEDWPFGQWSHGPNGVREYYQWLLATNDMPTIARFLEILAKVNLKGHWTCPCGSGQKVRNCCRAKIEELRKKIPPEIARKARACLALTPQPFRKRPVS
ncbi:MAG TPA: hypothetical protein VNL14_03440 [Candidatus Acidoferrales bacterium]|nr:hypothetical protein [Candidatus Acidoferrales bacterium]